MKDIRVVGLAKAFGTAPAVDHVDFEVAAGSLVTLLGPSGCGKTTTLRLIAGLEKPDAGEVLVGGPLLTSASQRVFLNPEKRRMGMVFQSYAIWPHMTVFGFPSTARSGSSCSSSWRGGLPMGSRFFTATMVQVGAELEESARIHGGSRLRTFVRIWVPLLRPAILGAWILLFVIAVRVLDLVVLLAGPGSRMLSVDIFLWTVTGRQRRRRCSRSCRPRWCWPAMSPPRGGCLAARLARARCSSHYSSVHEHCGLATPH